VVSPSCASCSSGIVILLKEFEVLKEKQ
jgi:hypothetical protein